MTTIFTVFHQIQENPRDTTHTNTLACVCVCVCCGCAGECFGARIPCYDFVAECEHVLSLQWFEINCYASYERRITISRSYLNITYILIAMAKLVVVTMMYFDGRLHWVDEFIKLAWMYTKSFQMCAFLRWKVFDRFVSFKSITIGIE